MSGYIRLHRSHFDRGPFAPEPLTEREAFLWLVCRAVHKPARVVFGGKRYELGRGELVVSVRDLGKQWRWPSSRRVHRFLERLVEAAVIALRSGGSATHVTICDYSTFSGRRNSGETPNGTPDDQLSLGITTPIPTPDETSGTPSGTLLEEEESLEEEDSGSPDGDPVPPGGATIADVVPLDLKSQVFGPIRRWWTRLTGKDDDCVRRWLGRWVADFGEAAVMQATLNLASRPPPLDPYSAMVSELQRITGRGPLPHGRPQRLSPHESLAEGFRRAVEALERGGAGDDDPVAPHALLRRR